MHLTIASLLDVVNRSGWTRGRADLLTYPEYVIFKGIDTIIDETRISLGLKWNADAPLFNPKIFLQTTEWANNSTSHYDMKRTSSKNVLEEINQSIDHNHTLQEKQYNESTKKEEK